jgi:hypothetical protein
MKKRLLFILLLLVPSVVGLECISYSDCGEITCAGSARLCVEGVCTYTACVTAGERLTGPGIDTMDTIVTWSVRLFVFLILAVIIALIIPRVNFKSKIRVISVIVLLGIVLTLALYFLGGESAIKSLLGREEVWYSTAADKYMMAAANAGNLEVTERVLKKGVKEYKFRDSENEAAALSFMIEPGSSKADLHLNVPDTLAKTIHDVEVNLQQNRFYDVYVWQEQSQVIVVAGDGEYARHVVNLLLEVNSTDIPAVKVSPNANMDALSDTPPTIRLIEPGEQASSTMVRFTVEDNDSLINASTISVSGISGFGPYDCVLVDRIYNCSFYADLLPGFNTVLISTADVYGKSSAIQRKFLFDNLSWGLEDFYPLNGSLVNIRTVKFRLIDNETGIDPQSFRFSGINLSLAQCTVLEKGVDCVFQNLNLSDGRTIITITGSDKAGNYRSAEHEFTLDTVRPAITIMTRGWQVFDSGGLGNDSIMVDHKRYAFDGCNLIDGTYHCRYDRSFSTVSVTDLAGNSATAENKLSR